MTITQSIRIAMRTSNPLATMPDIYQASCRIYGALSAQIRSHVFIIDTSDSDEVHDDKTV